MHSRVRTGTHRANRRISFMASSSYPVIGHIRHRRRLRTKLPNASGGSRSVEGGHGPDTQTLRRQEAPAEFLNRRESYREKARILEAWQPMGKPEAARVKEPCPRLISLAATVSMKRTRFLLDTGHLLPAWQASKHFASCPQPTAAGLLHSRFDPYRGEGRERLFTTTLASCACQPDLPAVPL